MKWRGLARWLPLIYRDERPLDVTAKAMGVIAFAALLGWWLRTLLTTIGVMGGP